MKEQKKQLDNLRKDYDLNELSKQKVDRNPFAQFEQWFSEALESIAWKPNAMTLATADAGGIPSARIVLLKGYSEAGFVFYTNYNSRKGQELLANPHAALLFYWKGLERQIRIEGKVIQMEAAQSEKYFQKRPKKSQIGAWASPQSTVIKGRNILLEKEAEYTTLYTDTEVLPCPPDWGGFIVQPTAFEFWQCRSNRLHDRIEYLQQADGQWHIQRLAP